MDYDFLKILAEQADDESCDYRSFSNVLVKSILLGEECLKTRSRLSEVLWSNQELSKKLNLMYADGSYLRGFDENSAIQVSLSHRDL